MWIWLLPVLVACTSGAAQQAEVTKVSSAELKDIMANKEVQLVDVRTPQEVAQGYIEGAVHINISSADFEERINQLDRQKPIAVYCAVGGRSGQAASRLKEWGFTEIYDANGGVREWAKSGYPLKKPE